MYFTFSQFVTEKHFHPSKRSTRCEMNPNNETVVVESTPSEKMFKYFWDRDTGRIDSTCTLPKQYTNVSFCDATSEVLVYRWDTDRGVTQCSFGDLKPPASSNGSVAKSESVTDESSSFHPVEIERRLTEYNTGTEEQLIKEMNDWMESLRWQTLQITKPPKVVARRKWGDDSEDSEEEEENRSSKDFNASNVMILFGDMDLEESEEKGSTEGTVKDEQP